jgi:hypothetical protein
VVEVGQLMAYVVGYVGDATRAAVHRTRHAGRRARAALAPNEDALTAADGAGRDRTISRIGLATALVVALAVLLAVLWTLFG